MISSKSNRSLDLSHINSATIFSFAIVFRLSIFKVIQSIFFELHYLREKNLILHYSSFI
jgi:hypothetical protein